MNPRRFDTLTKTLAATLSRRVLLRAGGAGLAGTVLSGAGVLGQDASPISDCAPWSEAENEAVVRRWYDEAINEGDLDIIEEIVAPNASQGPEETKRTLEAILTGYPDVHYTVELMIGSGDLVAVLWSATGTHEADYQGRPPTGSVDTWTGITIFQLACGQILQSWSEIDPVEQVWAVPAESGATPVATPNVLAGACQWGTPEENIAVAEAYLDVWNMGDLTLFDDITHPEVVHHWAQGQGTTIGMDALKANAETLLTAFPDIAISFDQVLSQDDYAVIRWTATGTQTGPFFDADPTGIVATWTGINIFQISCGKVVENWSKTDALGLRTQLQGDGASATPTS